MFAWWKASFNNLYFKPYMMKIIMKLNSDKVNILYVYFVFVGFLIYIASNIKPVAQQQQTTKIHTKNKLTALYKTTVLFVQGNNWSYICIHTIFQKWFFLPLCILLLPLIGRLWCLGSNYTNSMTREKKCFALKYVCCWI